MNSNHGARQYLPTQAHRMTLSNDMQRIASVVLQLQEMAQENLRAVDSRWLMQFGTALDESLSNAVLHGNLEITSAQRFSSGYEELLHARQTSFPYRRRTVQVEAFFESEQARVTVTDEGPGFDHTRVPDPTDPENLDRPHGRGVMMIRAYMDKVLYNQTGNSVAMIKQALPSA